MTVPADVDMYPPDREQYHYFLKATDTNGFNPLALSLYHKAPDTH